MDTWERFSLALEESKQAKKLDPVGHEDDDVDNDGDSDSSDTYLKKRRATVGAAIAADKKKKVEESKQLDAVGQEDKDIDNDGDHDKTDKYLLNRRKVRTKIIQREETEQIDEIAPLIAGGLALGGVLAAGAAIKKSQDAAKSGVDAANKGKQIKNPGTGIAGAAYGMQRRNNALNDAMKQLRQSYEQEGSLVEGKKKDDSYLETDMKKRRENNEKSVEDMKKTKGYADMVKSARKAMGVDEEFVGEDKEYRREMAKAAARERAEEKKSEENYRNKGRTGKKKEGPKLSTTPITDKTAKSYVDKELGQIKYMDKKTKGKHLVGNPFPEHVEYEIEEGMSMKDFKANRKKLQRKEASVDAEKRGHVERTWGTGRKYTPDEAKRSRANMTDTERSARHRVAVDPDNDDNDNYSADKTKDPKKLRKQKAMGEGYLAEKSLSRAQQRFMGMVYAAKKGETPASPEVAKAAEGMTKKSARDFAKTKHEGLPEKKEETKEEFSLLDKILAEASDAQFMAAKARREERQKKQSDRMRQAKVSVAANQAMQDDKEKEKEKPKSGRGINDPSAYVRGQSIKSASEIKKEKEKTARYKMRRADVLVDREQKSLKEREKERIAAEEEKKKAKQKRKSELKQDIKSALSGGMKVGSGRKDTETAGALMSNVGSIASGVAKTGVALGKYAWKKRQERKEEEKQKKEEQTQKENFSNWREEFIFEVDDQTVRNEKEKIIDVSKKKNKIEINPNMSEECGCDEKKEKETPVKDMRELPTKVSLTKTKMRSAGVRNPIVMVASEENVQEFAALAPLVARLVGGTAARGIAGRIAGGAAQGSLRAKAAEFAGKKSGEVVSQSVQDKMTPQPQQPQQQGDEYWISNIGGKKVRNEDWQSVNRKDKTDGLSQKAVNAYRSENPGSKLQTAVTEKKPTGKRAERRKSFCSRMNGMKDRLTSAETARDPDSNINKALRRWNCN